MWPQNGDFCSLFPVGRTPSNSYSWSEIPHICRAWSFPFLLEFHIPAVPGQAGHLRGVSGSSGLKAGGSPELHSPWGLTGMGDNENPSLSPPALANIGFAGVLRWGRAASLAAATAIVTRLTDG